MPSFSQKSQQALDTCDSLLVEVFSKVIRYYDCTIIEGYRSLDRQRALLAQGRTKVGRGKHNQSPSLAVDVAPFLEGRGIPWPQTPDWHDAAARQRYIKDLAQFYHFAGFVEAIALDLGIPIRWGGDWDRDHDLADQTFDDLVHFELL